MSWILGLVAAGIAVALVIGDDAARASLAQMALTTTGVVVVLQIANVSADSVRYRMVLPQRYRGAIGTWTWHRIFAVGRLLNAAIPQGGMAYRAAHLRVLGVPVVAFIGSVAAVSWLGNGLVLTLVGALVALSGAPGTGLAITAIGVAILVLIALVPRLERSGSSRLPPRLRSAASAFGESFVELVRGSGRMRAVLIVTLATQLSGATAFVVICVALGVDDPLIVGAVLYAATTVVTVVSLTPASIGITELAAGLAGGLLDIGGGVGILVALITRATGLISVGVLAVVAVGMEAWTARSEPNPGEPVEHDTPPAP